MNCVILCGGSGSRLWPLSTPATPKQFLRLTNEYTMMQNTIRRMQSIMPDIRICIICNQNHEAFVKAQVDELGVLNATILCEPVGRDSAAAICIAALRTPASETTIVVPCDHVFNDKEFGACYHQASAYEDAIITFGVRPTSPETGYGYIHVDEATGRTIEFVEKPSYEVANRYVESGQYLWNAGVFYFKNATMLRCFERYAPDILTVCRQVLDGIAISENSVQHLPHTLFSNVRAISVDYAIMEPLTKEGSIPARTIQYKYHWNDIGTYAALYAELPKDSSENVVRCPKLTSVDTRHCYIHTDLHVALVGVEDLIVVQSGTSLLICKKSESQNVKKIVNLLDI